VRRVYGRYSFADAYNPNTGWIIPDVVGIASRESFTALPAVSPIAGASRLGSRRCLFI